LQRLRLGGCCKGRLLDFARRSRVGQHRAPSLRCRSRDFGHLSGKDHRSLAAGYNRPLLRFEAHDQADPLLFSNGFVPGDPQTIGRPQFRLALKLCHVFGGKHVLPVRDGVRRVTGHLVKSVDNNRALDFDRLFVLLVEKIDPAPKSAHRTVPGLMAHGVNPGTGDLDRFALTPLLGRFPGNVFAQVKLGTACQEERDDGQYGDGDARLAGRVGNCVGTIHVKRAFFEATLVRHGWQT
jgi:hypothetical protein